MSEILGNVFDKALSKKGEDCEKSVLKQGWPCQLLACFLSGAKCFFCACSNKEGGHSLFSVT